MSFRFQRSLVLGIALAASSGVVWAEEIPVVGLDQDRKPFVRGVPAEEFMGKLNSALSATHGSVLPALEARSCEKPAQNTKMSWALRTVVVGISVGMEAGLGPIIGMSAGARFRLIYTNHPNPSLPD